MFTFLSRILIPGAQNPEDPAVRRAYGSLCGVLGICLNLLLFGGKLFAGTLAASVAITADAFNNLSVRAAASSPSSASAWPAVGPTGATLSAMAASSMWRASLSPFSSCSWGWSWPGMPWKKFCTPSPLQSGWLPLAILAVSILVKLYMYGYQRRTAKMLRSAAMAATAADSPLRRRGHCRGPVRCAAGPAHRSDGGRLVRPGRGRLHRR